MGISTKRYGDESINPAKMTDDAREYGYAFYNGRVQPNLSLANGYGDPSGTGGTLNRAFFPGSYPLHASYSAIVTQTLLGPLLDTAGDGLDVSQDQTDDDGVQYTFGANNSYGPYAWTVGTHNGFIRMKMKIADVSGTDDCLVGLRKVEAIQAAVDDYDEMAALNVILGDIKIETILNNAATTTTDTTDDWADAAVKTLEVQLVGRQARFLIDGVAPTVNATFSFDSGEVVVPFFFFLQATTTPGKVFWREVEIGRLRAKSSSGVDSYNVA